eukprot:CAMPEP_0185773602 /NCGR_PEP_ID=MMETSP1174-20130828/74314_1 /TAXON_ID=35687 /ORGANISM="Dictyocha speculum, Strain CCMP1381" /LENGTH=162 /DNA_ID=CAMNT_0028460367 /DNA_START=59 /DNA_END=547 /DNA_ORIENTATION=-
MSIRNLVESCDVADRRTRELIDVLTQLVNDDAVQYLVTSAHGPEPIIVGCSRSWCERCGYSASEVVNRSCRFLQGPETDGKKLNHMRQAWDTRESSYLEVINYDKNGNSFLNKFVAVPLNGKDGHTVFYASIHEPSIQVLRRLSAIMYDNHINTIHGMETSL